MKYNLPRLVSQASIAALGLCLTSCTEPVSQMLKDNGNFALVRPTREGMHLGDLHRKTNLQEESVPMSDVYSRDQLNSLMSSRSKRIDLPESTGSKTYDVNVKAAYVGVAAAELNAKHASKFSVKVTNPVLYDAPFDAELSPNIIPAIQRKFPHVNLEDKYIIRSLIKVDGLEYEFYNEKGGKINIAADKALVNKLTSAELGVGWSVTKNSKLIIKQPRFIGYRLAKVRRDGEVVGTGAMPSGRTPDYSLQKTSGSEYPVGAFPATRR